MVYVRKRVQPYNEAGLRAAILEIQNKGNFLRTCRKYKIPRSTLRAYVKRNKTLPTGEITLKTDKIPVFHEKKARQLLKTIMQLQTIFYGLKNVEICRTAYQYAEIHHLRNAFNKKEKMAGKKWLKSFMESQKVTRRKVESSKQTKENINTYFYMLKDIIQKYKISAENIYNLDEFVLAEHSTTVVTAVSSTGGYVQPMIVLPDNSDAQPTENLDLVRHTLNGQINLEVFLEYLQHFIRNTCPSADRQIILLLDGLNIHKNLHAVKLCRENHIHLIVFPPNTISRLQPLFTIFEQFKYIFDNTYEEIKKENTNLLEVIEQSFNSVFDSPYNISKCFESKGINPYNSNVLDEDYLFFTTQADKVIEHVYYWHVPFEEEDFCCTTFDDTLLKKEQVMEETTHISSIKEEISENEETSDFANILENIKTDEDSNEAPIEEDSSNLTEQQNQPSPELQGLDFLKGHLAEIAQFSDAQKQRLLSYIKRVAKENK